MILLLLSNVLAVLLTEGEELYSLMAIGRKYLLWRFAVHLGVLRFTAPGPLWILTYGLENAAWEWSNFYGFAITEQRLPSSLTFTICCLPSIDLNKIYVLDEIEEEALERTLNSSLAVFYSASLQRQALHIIHFKHSCQNHQTQQFGANVFLSLIIYTSLQDSLSLIRDRPIQVWWLSCSVNSIRFNLTQAEVQINQNFVLMSQSHLAGQFSSRRACSVSWLVWTPLSYN